MDRTYFFPKSFQWPSIHFQTNPLALNPFSQHLMGLKPLVSLKSLCSWHLPQWQRDTSDTNRRALGPAGSALVKGERKLVSYSPARQKLKLLAPRRWPRLARYSKGTKRHRTAGFNGLTCGILWLGPYQGNFVKIRANRTCRCPGPSTFTGVMCSLPSLLGHWS